MLCDVIPRRGLGMTQDLGNSRILVIASEAKQSLEILNSLSSLSPFRGSLYGILNAL